MTDPAISTNGAQTVNPLDLFKSAKAGFVPEKPKAAPIVEAPAAPAPEIPAILAFDGEKEIRIPETAKFKRTVEGEGEVEFTAKDLFNSFKTSRQIDREFSKLDKEKKLTAREKEEVTKARAELAHIDTHIKQMAEAITNRKPLEAVEIATRLAGAGNEGTIQDLVKQAQEISQQFENMTPEEEAQFWATKKLEREKQAIAKARADLDWDTYKSNLKEYVDNVKSKLSISDDELGAAFLELQSYEPLLKKAGQPPILEGKDGHAITAECAKWVLGGRFKSRITNCIAQVSSKEAKNEKLIASVIELADASWSDGDIKDLVKGYLEDDSTNQPSKDSKKEVSKPDATPKAEVSQPKAKPEGASRGASEAEKGAERKPILSWKEMIAKHS